MSHLQKAQTGNKLLLARGSRALSALTRGRRRPPSAEFSPERQLCPEAARPAGACSETRAWPFSSVSRAEECQFSPGVWETHVCSFSLAEAAALPERSRGVFDCDGGFFLPGGGGGGHPHSTPREAAWGR